MSMSYKDTRHVVSDLGTLQITGQSTLSAWTVYYYLIIGLHYYLARATILKISGAFDWLHNHWHENK